MSRSHEDILRAVEFHHEQYIKNLRLLNEMSIAGVAGGVTASMRMERAASSDSAPSPATRASAFAHDMPRPSHTTTFASDTLSVQSGPSKRGRRLTNERFILDRRSQPASVFDAESDSDEDEDFLPVLSPSQTQFTRVSEDNISYVSKYLERESFSEEDLVRHLQSLDEAQEATVTALGHVFQKRREVKALGVIEALEEADDDSLDYTSGTYEVFEVKGDKKAVAKHDRTRSDFDEMLDAGSVWETLKESNPSGDAHGRITILQEPTPIMLASVHLTMQRHFDMDELFRFLVLTKSTKGKTKAFMHRAFESDSKRQRSFFFAFKYHTIVGKDLIPAPWQQYDHRPPDRRSPDHIDIAECSSVLALYVVFGNKPLHACQVSHTKNAHQSSAGENTDRRLYRSLGGPPAKEVQARKRKGGVLKGAVYDTFAPWHLLNIQFFPDDEHSMRSEDIKKPFCNGPHAFLDSLAKEYRDAVKRYTQLNLMITKLITPPSEFMFDVRTRDKLLFEDQYFTYSRRYFWAYTTLGVINDGINTARAAYLNSFTNEFWDGRHKTLWPLPDPDSAVGRAYLVSMQGLRHDIERAVRELHGVYEKNEQTRTEIRSLREQLFSGSSVKESRRAIEQGDNIKVLTMVSMVFLPLTFVTSVFGITEFTLSAQDWEFPVTMVAVCVPFFIIVLVLQTRAGMEAAKKLGRLVDNSFRRIFEAGERRQSSASDSGNGESGTEGRKKKRGHRGKRRGLKRIQSALGDASASGTMPENGNARLKFGLWLPWKRQQPGQNMAGNKGGEV